MRANCLCIISSYSDNHLFPTCHFAIEQCTLLSSSPLRCSSFLRVVPPSPLLLVALLLLLPKKICGSTLVSCTTLTSLHSIVLRRVTFLASLCLRAFFFSPEGILQENGNSQGLTLKTYQFACQPAALELLPHYLHVL